MLFFEAAAGRRQIGRIHQSNRVRLHALAAEQALQQVLIDLAQAADPYLPPEFVQHSRAGPMTAQAGKPTPGGLFGQLRHQKIA